MIKNKVIKETLQNTLHQLLRTWPKYESKRLELIKSLRCYRQLLVTEARQELAQASQEQLDEIYGVVGGNPLALKLVLGQIHALPLSQVLHNLKQAQGRKTMALYTYIYWQSWQALSDVGRQALLTLPVASPRGSTAEHLQVVSGLQAEALSQALEELVAFSLVEVGGDLEMRRYSIHRLTETFLLTEVTQWPSSP